MLILSLISSLVFAKTYAPCSSIVVNDYVGKEEMYTSSTSYTNPMLFKANELSVDETCSFTFDFSVDVAGDHDDTIYRCNRTGNLYHYDDKVEFVRSINTTCTIESLDNQSIADVAKPQLEQMLDDNSFVCENLYSDNSRCYVGTLPRVSVSTNVQGNGMHSYQVQIKIKNLDSVDYPTWTLTALLPTELVSANCWEDGGSIQFSHVGRDMTIQQSTDPYFSTLKAHATRVLRCQIDRVYGNDSVDLENIKLVVGN